MPEALTIVCPGCGLEEVDLDGRDPGEPDTIEEACPDCAGWTE